ncbi:MAG: galactose-1-phosphate uridylyltransferase [Candidatus Omnitrophica bacterium]|nr:galactose-1-phosphate uridylyltransferase [Candidatus Omnitrophota bacterium]
MPELRRDPIIGRWVIIATERAKRPTDFSFTKKEDASPPSEKCPFCEGNESLTPPEIYALRKKGTKPNKPGWEIRVVPSISPFLKTEGDLDRHGKGMYDLMNGIGAHEVIIATPHHDSKPFIKGLSQIEKLSGVIIRRMQELKKDQRLKYVLIFKNQGKIAGGSKLGHQHLQLIATPVTPKRVKEELVGSKRYFDYKDRCVFCDMLRQELDDQKRIVLDLGGFVAVNPYCSRFPFETWILPKRHSCDFDSMTKKEIKGYSEIFQLTLKKLVKTLGDFPYNIVLHTAPLRRRKKKGYWETIEADYHWHIEIMPRLTQVAGFEWGSGFYINPVPPEDACKYLKEANNVAT